MSNYAIPRKQVNQSIDPKDYADNRVIVAGSRGWSDKRTFHAHICEFIDNVQGDVLFISGAASSGADRMIIDWAARWHYPCLQVPARWSDYEHMSSSGRKNPAGFIRNKEMKSLCTHLIAFHDGYSAGTQNMIEICSDVDSLIRVTTISIPRKDAPVWSYEKL